MSWIIRSSTTPMSVLRPGYAGEPVRLDEARACEFLLQCAERRVEPLDVPDLQDEPLRRGQLNELARLLGIVGDRFFHEHMLPRAKQLARDVVMRAGGRGNGGGVDFRGQRLHAGKGLHAVTLRGPFSATWPSRSQRPTNCTSGSRE